MDLSRRRFLEAAAIAAAAAPAAIGAQAAPATGVLPKRVLGKTGIEVTILGFGSGSRFLMYEKEDEALAALEKALALGIRYIDTANGYGDGKSEERIGRILPEHRKDLVVATKLGARKADDARRQIEASLKRLRTDHLDVLHIHALSDLDDLAAIEKPGGVLEAVYEARDQKVTRAVGITCHADPVALKTAIERHDFDVTQMALNAALARMANQPGGMKATPMREGSFEDLALPVAVSKKMGVIAMKVFGQDQIKNAAPTDELLRYALSLPVSLTSLGMPKLEFIEANVAVARNFQPMSPLEKEKLKGSIRQELKVAHRAFYRDHLDA